MQKNNQIQQAWDLVARQYILAKCAPAGHSISGQTTITSQIMTLWKLRSHIRKPWNTRPTPSCTDGGKSHNMPSSVVLCLNAVGSDSVPSSKSSWRMPPWQDPKDTHLCRVVQQVAPKQRRRKLQLRDAHGLPQTGAQKLACIIRFYPDLYCDLDTSQAMQPRSGEFPCFTEEWHQASMYLMPKPGKFLRSAADLRPIALLSLLPRSWPEWQQNV